MKSRSVVDYINAAKARAGFKSDRALGMALGGSVDLVAAWRNTARKYPSDEKMLRLADMAGIPRDQALLDLADWKADETTRATWRLIRAKLASVAAAVLLVFLVPSFVPSGNVALGQTVYYGKWRALISALESAFFRHYSSARMVVQVR